MLSSGLFKHLLTLTDGLPNVRHLSNKSAVVTKIHRSMYMKKYMTVIVQPNGATYTVRHYEPRRIIKLPVDLAELSPEERQVFLERRKPKKKVVVEEEIEDNFNSQAYLNLMRKP